MNSISLKIEGMSCGHCLARVRETLNAFPGVKTESLELGSARLRLEEGAPSPETVAAAVSAAGYPTRIEPGTE